MSYFVLILILVIICWPWIWRHVSRWLSNYMSRRAEDMMRRMMGMPPRDRKRGRGARDAFSDAGRRRAQDSGATESHKGKSAGRSRSIAALMQLVAVDVTYTEIKEFSSSTIGGEHTETFRYILEEQITDVKFEEIKDRRS